MIQQWQLSSKYHENFVQHCSVSLVVSSQKCQVVRWKGSFCWGWEFVNSKLFYYIGCRRAKITKQLVKLYLIPACSSLIGPYACVSSTSKLHAAKWQERNQVIYQSVCLILSSGQLGQQRWSTLIFSWVLVCSSTAKIEEREVCDTAHHSLYLCRTKQIPPSVKPMCEYTAR